MEVKVKVRLSYLHDLGSQAPEGSDAEKFLHLLRLGDTAVQKQAVNVVMEGVLADPFSIEWVMGCIDRNATHNEVKVSFGDLGTHEIPIRWLRDITVAF